VKSTTSRVQFVLAPGLVNQRYRATECARTKDDGDDDLIHSGLATLATLLAFTVCKDKHSVSNRQYNNDRTCMVMISNGLMVEVKL
jgi:hypothetical protein